MVKHPRRKPRTRKKNRHISPAWGGDLLSSHGHGTLQAKEMVPMTHTLMHKDIPVADLTLDEATGSIQPD